MADFLPSKTIPLTAGGTTAPRTSTNKRKATTAVSAKSRTAPKRSRYVATVEDDPEEHVGPTSSGTLSGSPPGPQLVAKDISSDSLATLVSIIVNSLHVMLIPSFC